MSTKPPSNHFSPLKGALRSIYRGWWFLLLVVFGFHEVGYGQVIQNFTANGTYTVPAGVTEITVEAWGGGGRGATRNSNGVGGGGGGGAFARRLVIVVPGTTYNIQVGGGSTTAAAGGDSWFWNATTVLAKGGNSAADNSATGALGGAAAQSIGDQTFSGGNGFNGATNLGGGGGSSAGTASNGTSATSRIGAVAPTGGGNGGDGFNGADGDGQPGISPGGGGGGANRTGGTENGGNGANGLVRITVPIQSFATAGTSTFTVPANVFQITVSTWGGGGNGGSVASAIGAAGGGGGAYSEGTINVTPGTQYRVIVGAGGAIGAAANSGGTSSVALQSNPSVLLVAAVGGGGVASGSATFGAGGLGASGVGTIRRNGGAGSAPLNTGGAGNRYSGGGGSSAGISANGNLANQQTGGLAPTGGGSGGNGVFGNTSNTGTAGTAPGGGGGGAKRTTNGTTNGGAGAAGQVLISWKFCTSSIVYPASGTYCRTNTTPQTPTVVGITGGTWSASPAGLTINTTTGAITPSTSTPGTYTISNTNQGCTVSPTVTIQAAPTTATVGANQSICGVLSTALGGNTPTVGTGLWTRVSGTSNVTFSNPNAGNSTATLQAPVTAGAYVFRWTISNGVCASSSADITVTYNTSTVTITPGAALADICQGTSSAAMGVTVTGATAFSWSDGGIGGSFSPNNTVQNPTWTPPLTYNGTATLSLVASNGPCTQSGSKTLLVRPGPVTVNPGPNTAICANNGATFIGSTAGFTGSGNQFAWSTSNGTGIFVDENTLNDALYNVSPADIAAGTRNLRLTVSFNGLCARFADKSLIVEPAPTVNAGTASNTICSNTASINPFQAGLTTVSNNPNGVEWISNGSGTWANPNSLTNAVYTLSAADQASTGFTITLSSIGTTACGDITSDKTYTIIPAPTLNPGSDVTLCSNAGISSVATDAVASQVNTSSILWTKTGGLGTLANTNSLQGVTYTPNVNESGTITLTLTANGNGPCASVLATKTLTIVRAPIAEAGPDIQTCSNILTPVNITGGSSTNHRVDILWSRSGTGTLFNPLDSNTAAYTPSPADIAAGQVTFTLTANGNSPCAAATDTKKLIITTLPVGGFSYAGPFCKDLGTNPQPVMAPSGVKGVFTSSNPANLVVDATTGAINIALSSPGTYTVTNTVAAANGCQAVVETASVTINPILFATFSYIGTYCKFSGAANPVPSFSGGGVAGTFSCVNPALVFASNATGEINLAATPAGTYTVRNTVDVANDGCAPVIHEFMVTLNAQTTANFSYVGSPFCISGGPILPTFSGGGVAGNFTSAPAGLAIIATTGEVIFNSSASGGYAVTNTVPAINGCPAAVFSSSVTINQPAITGFSYTLNPFCKTASNPGPTLVPGGTAGTFTGSPGLVIGGGTGIVNIASTNPGTYSVTNTVTNTNGCPASFSSTTITITALPQATFNYPASAYCTNLVGTISPNMGTSTIGAFSASPTSGLALNTTNGVITPSSSAPNSYSVTNTIAAAGGCPQVSETVPLTITQLPIANFSYAKTSYCKSETNPTVTLASGGSHGTYSATPSGLVFANAQGTINLGASAPGTYTVTNSFAASGGCGPVSFPRTVTIVADAIVTLASGNPNATSCIGLPIGSIVYNVSGSGTGATASGLPPGVTAVFNSGTLTISGTPTAAGVYPFTVTATGSCAPASLGGTLTIGALPTMVLSSPTNTRRQFLCSGGAIVPIVYTLGGSANNYTITGLPAGVVANLVGNTITISGTPPAAAATYNYTITATNTSACPTGPSLTGSIRVDNAAPVTNGPIVGPDGLCPPISALNYNVPAGSNVGYYLWVFSVGFNPVMGDSTNSITVDVTFPFFGTNNVSVQAINGCGNGATISIPILVNDFAAVTVIEDTATCFNQSINLRATRAGSASSVAWSFTPVGAGTLSNSNIDQPTFTPAAGFTGTVNLTVVTNDPAGTCTPGSDNMTLRVLPLPAATIGAGSTICAGSSSSVTISGTAGARVFYTVNGGTEQSIDLGAGGSASLSTGPVSTNQVFTLTRVRYSSGLGCEQTISGQSATVTVNPAVIVSAGADQLICQGTVANLTGSISGGTTTGTWQLVSGSGSIASPGSLNTSFTPAVGFFGTVQLRLQSIDPAGPCPAVSDLMDIVVNQAATIDAGPATASVCSNGNLTLTATIGGAATTIQWISAAGGTFTNPTGISTQFTPPGLVAPFNVTASTNDPDGAGPCTAATDAVLVTVVPAVQVNAGIDQVLCQGTVANLSGTISGAITSGNWSVISGSGSFANASSLTTTFTPSSTGTIVLRLTSNNPGAPCSIAQDDIQLTVNPRAIVSAGPDQATCVGTTIILNGSFSGGATGITWSVTPGQGTFTNANAPASAFTPNASILSGTITLTLTTNDPDGPGGPCVAVSDNMDVVINPLPSNPNSPTATTPGCGSVTITRNGAPTSPIAWFWQTTATGISTAQDAVNPLVVSASGTTFIRARNTTTGCWSTGSASIAVVVNPIPAAPPVPGSNGAQCTETGVTLTRGTPPAGQIWYWQTSPTGTATAPVNAAPTYLVTVAGTMYIRALETSTNCWSNATAIPVTILAAPPAPAPITVGATQCADVGTSLSFTGAPPANTTWFWQTASNGTNMTNSASPLTVTTGGTYFLRARDNGSGCWGGEVSAVAAVNALPATPANPTASALPNCGTATLTRVGSPSGADLWYWQTAPAGVSLVDNGNTFSPTASGTYYLRARNSNGCWSSSSGMVSVVVNALPAVPPAPTSNSPQCFNVGVTVTRTAPPSGETYFWQTTAGGTSTANSSLTRTTTVNGDDFFLRSQTSEGCWSATSSSLMDVVVNALPGNPGNPTTSNNDACEDVGVTLTKPAGQPGGVQWFWQSISTGQDETNFANTFSQFTPGSSTVFLRAKNTTTNCWSAGSGSLAITVRANPSPNLGAFYCEVPAKVRLKSSSTIPISSYLWDPIIPVGNPNTGVNYDVDVAGRFNVTLTYTNGCVRTNFIDVAENLVVNGDFEANVDYRNPATRGFVTEYVFRPRPINQAQRDLGCTNLPGCTLDPVPLPNCGGATCAPGLFNETTYAVDANANDFHSAFFGQDHTTGTGKFLMINGSINPSPSTGTLRVIWQQTINIDPNTDYYFSAWAMNLNPGSPARLRFEVNGVQVGTIADLDLAPKPTSQAQVSRSNWIRFYSDPKWNSGSATTAQVRIINLNPDAGGNDFALDDITFGTLSPNPVSIISVNASTPVCPDSTITLVPTISGGRTPFIYQWLGPNGFSSNAVNPVITGAQAANGGTYTLRVIDGYNCNPPATAVSNAVTVLAGSPGVWTGVTSTDWYFCGNWQSGRVPTATTDVTIPLAAPRDVTINKGTSIYDGGLNAFARKITIAKSLSFGNSTDRLEVNDSLIIENNTGVLNMATGGDVALFGGNWVNRRGTAGFDPGTDANSRVRFLGAIPQFIRSTAATEAFFNLTVNNSSATGLSLLTPARVDGGLFFNAGLINTRSNPPGGPATSLGLLTVGPTGFLAGAVGADASGGNITRMVTGQMAKEFTTNLNEFIFPIGKTTPSGRYRPAGAWALTQNGTTTFTAEYFPFAHPIPSTLLGPNLFGIIRPEHWQIDRTGAATGRVKINYIYPGQSEWIANDNLPAAGPCGSCNVAVVQKNGSNQWNFTGSAGVYNDTDPEYREFVNSGWIYSKPLNTFSPFSIGYSFNIILPIDLISFTGRAVASTSQLNWEVASTADLGYFDIEHSANGLQWQTIATVKAANSTKYSYTHLQPVPGANYYRLNMVERNGLAKYSHIVLVQHAGQGETFLKGVRPNPVRRDAYIDIFAARNMSVEIRVVDMAGRSLAVRKANAAAGINTIPLYMGNLPQGMYLIEVITEDRKQGVFKVIKE